MSRIKAHLMIINNVKCNDEVMQMNGFNLIQSVNPVTTTAMVPEKEEEIEYLIHGNEIELEKDLFIVEGYRDDMMRRTKAEVVGWQRKNSS